ncbi:MAG: ribonuclease III [Alphaproteobacteria bacterium]
MALVHRSAGGRRRADNERLEFLGDRVLGLAVADLLYHRFAAEPEGGLSKRHAALVRRETLAEVAADWALGPLLQLSAGERAAGGAANPATLADAVEAVIGAVYEDGGFAPARALVVRFWSPRLAGLAEAPRDAKTSLQEWSQAHGLGLPAYREVAREGPSHDPRFVVEVALAPHPPVRAEGRSKRAAEQEAAALMLARVAEGVA